MKSGIHKIKRLPGRMLPYFRFRHVRGRGVHSPFAYGIIRNALLFGKGYSGGPGQVFTALKLLGTGRRRAMQLQNLHSYCGYGRTVIHHAAGTEQIGDGEPVMHIFTRSCPVETIERFTSVLQGTETIAVLTHSADKAKSRLCRRMAGQGDCISIDNRGFMLFFYGSGHAPKHYKI